MLAIVSTLGANIRAARKRAGFSQAKAFAHAAGVPQTRVSDWEKGRYKALKLQTLFLIAKTAKCSLDDILRGMDPDYDTMRDLTRPADAADSSVSEESPHGSASARLLELERLAEHYRTTVGALEDLHAELGAVVARAHEAGAAGAPTTRRRPHRRTAHR